MINVVYFDAQNAQHMGCSFPSDGIEVQSCPDLSPASFYYLQKHWTYPLYLTSFPCSAKTVFVLYSKKAQFWRSLPYVQTSRSVQLTSGQILFSRADLEAQMKIKANEITSMKTSIIQTRIFFFVRSLGVKCLFSQIISEGSDAC